MASGHATLPVPSEGKISLPVWNDELYFEYHRGVFTTQVQSETQYAAKRRAIAQRRKILINSLALQDAAVPGMDRLNEAWKKTLFNQFHDLAAGSGIGVIYKDAQK